MQGRTVLSTRLHQKRDLPPRHRLRLRMLPRRHRQGLRKRPRLGRTAPESQGLRLSKLLQNLHRRQHSAILFTGYAGRVEKSMACIATAATLAVRPSTLRGTSTNTPRTGYVPIVKTRYRSSGPFAIVESGGRGAHRSSIMVKLQKTASSQRGLQLPRWYSTGGRW